MPACIPYHSKKKHQIVVVLLLFASLSLSKKAFSQVPPTDKNLILIKEEIKKMVKDSIIPSMAVAVVKDDKILWQEAIGYANIATKKPATIHSIYPLGSVSKSITATGIMQMVNNDEIRLSQDIRPLLAPIQIKDINGKTPEIKLWQLVSMNSGINHGYGVFDDINYLPRSTKDKKKFYEETTIVAFEPGNVYEYSNRAFYLSELIIEHISGMPFQDSMDKNLFHPLGMKNTKSYPYQYPENKDFVTTYSAKNLEELEQNISYPAGGSGFWSSISDMTNYVMFHLGNLMKPGVVNEKNLSLMHGFRQGPADLFGIGWFNSGDQLYSNGNVSGGNAAVSLDLEKGLGIVCLVNKTSWDGIADQYVEKIKEIFIENPDRDGFKEWQRIYGTPYSSRYELYGTWQGIIKQPVTGKEAIIEMTFDQTDSIALKINGKSVVLNDPTYNLFNELEGSFNAVLPIIYEKETRCGLKLKKTGTKLSGYVQYDHNSEHRYYRLPLYMELSKIR